MVSAPAAVMPPHLRMIYEAVNQFEAAPCNFDLLQPGWAAHVTQVSRQIEGVQIEAGGEALFLGNLSPGCRACKEGSWDCIFITMGCNLDCPFCYSPHAIPRNATGSTFGATPEQIAGNHAKTRITGISFSGGEPFLQSQRLFTWLAWFKASYPTTYYWLYTNGLPANANALQQLGKLGLDEIRFNLAATGYDHPLVMENVAIAARFIPNITVEIPAIPAQAPTLLSSLERWASLGARFLNLHELIYEPGTNSATMAGVRQPIITPDGHQSAINPESRALTLKVMRHIQALGLPLSVNDCSLQSKLRQLRGRRRCLAPLIKAPYEKLTHDGLFESYCAYRGQELHFFHPDMLDERQRQYPHYHFVRVAKTAPLSLQENEKWVIFEPLRTAL